MIKPLAKPQGFRSSAADSLRGEIHVPGDKSISHRALMLASQVLGTTRVEGLLEGEDVLRTAEALRQLGVTVTRHGEGSWEVRGVGLHGLCEPAAVLDMGNSGTAARLLMGLLTPFPFTAFMTGDESLCKRPMQRVITPLEQMGAEFTTREGGRMPLSIRGASQPMPISYTLPVASAQVKSAVLLAGLNTPGTTSVTEPEPTRDHTERMLRYFGFEVNISNGAIAISGNQFLPPSDRHITVPGDISSAAFLIVAALITPNSNITIHSVGVNPLRTGLLDVLQRMGADIKLTRPRDVAGEPVADIDVHYSPLRAVEVEAAIAPRMIDEYPILAVAAAFASGTSVMHGLAELRVKESNRLQAIIDGLRSCGIEAKESGDSLHVTGQSQPPGGASITTYFDHRIAMAFLVMGLATKNPVAVDDIRAIETSFPGFIPLLNQLGGKLEPISPPAQSGVVVAIDGPAASGKGTLGRRLAEHYGWSYLDTGSLYRAVGIKLVYNNKDPNDRLAAVEAARSITDDDLANPRLRNERVGQAASIVSAMPEVRAILLEYQREFARRPSGAVLDGRDIGTVVCPEADIKFFLTADVENRARRRHRELQGQGIEVVYESVLADLIERDERDQKRSVAPLTSASDALTLDTSEMDAASVFHAALTAIEERLKGRLKQALRS